MLSMSMNEAVRRSAWTCIACSGVARCPQALITSSGSKHPGSRHQRKHSSSKTPSPPKDDSRPPTSTSEAPSNKAATKPRVEKRPSYGRRPSKTSSKQSAPMQAPLKTLPSIPSVPSTQHLHPLNVHVASFFSHHRPISVSTAFPPVSTQAAFSSIFEPKPKPSPSDVIYTVSAAINNLENASSQQAAESSIATARPVKFRHRASTNDAETIHLDAQPTQQQHFTLDIEELSKTFRPFNVPPPPVPMPDPSAAVEEPSPIPKRRTRAKATKERTYTTVLTITEQSYPNGRRTFQASLSPLQEGKFFTPSLPSANNTTSSHISPQQHHHHYQHYQHQEEGEMQVINLPPHRQPFLQRMQYRQLIYDESLVKRLQRKRGTWRMISVKRQRKLKMKKHKYKKLMRKTRNLRRRLDRN